jgi:4-hydroxythreonine-4-phosphate dehydrogenase
VSPAPLCVTQGDPSGIGPDIALTLYANGAGLPPFFLLADPDLLRRRATLLGLDVTIAECAAEQTPDVFGRALPVVPLRNRARGTPGQPDPTDATATVEAIERAVDFLREGRARAMVTNPIAKSVLYAAGFAHPGHTEFLGELAAQKIWRNRASRDDDLVARTRRGPRDHPHPPQRRPHRFA